MENTCLSCLKSLTTYTDDFKTAVDVQGDIDCCCGDIDETSGHTVYSDAECLECCAKNHAGFQIWDGKGAGGGFYIVNPS